MRKWVMLVALGLPAIATADPGNGVDLSWDDCVGGPAADYNQNFLCTGTVDQSYRLFVQFESSIPIDQAGAWTATMEYLNETGNLGDAATGFWRLEQACPGSGVRGLAVSSTPPVSCSEAGFANVSDDGGAMGVAWFEWFSNRTSSDYTSPGRAKIVASYARPTGITIEAGARYYVMHLVFNNRNRVACPDGCGDPGAIALVDLFIESYLGYAKSVHLSGVNQFTACPTINDGYYHPCWGSPVRSATWGRLKAMYR